MRQLVMRPLIVIASLLAGASAIPAMGQVSGSIGIGAPDVNLALHFGAYPQFIPVPGYPVYYAPQVDANYFFYDGMYWVYQNDNWYASSWYNGPWALVSPMIVPVYVLRVPVRYYRAPPVYFRGWRPDAPPRWGEHWGQSWAHQHVGWDRTNHGQAPAIAPLPSYQQKYYGKTYPSYEQQRSIGHENYGYQPREPVVQQHYQRYETPAARRQEGNEDKGHDHDHDHDKGN